MDILCIGDSLTYGYGVGRPHTWCAIASQLTGHRFINLGVNGATTGEMLDGLEDALSRHAANLEAADVPAGGLFAQGTSAQSAPSTASATAHGTPPPPCTHPRGGLFVMGGLNDLFMGMPIAAPLRHVRAICERARQAGLAPAVGLPMQISEQVSEGWCEGPVDMALVRAAYTDFAGALLVQCREDDVPVLDFRPLLGPADLGYDGVHLNRLGHQHMADAVADFWR